MNGFVLFQIFYACMIIWTFYISMQCAKNHHHLRNRVLFLYIAANSASFVYFCSTFIQNKVLFDICNSISYVCLDITILALLYYLVDFTMIGKNRSYSPLVEKAIFILVGLDSIFNLTNPLHHMELTYTPYMYATGQVVYEAHRESLFYFHLFIAYLLVAFCFDVLLKKCLRTPKAYRTRYSNLLITLCGIVFLNFVFMFTNHYLKYDYSYPLYTICAYIVHKNTFYYSNSKSMNMSKRIILEYLNSPVALFDYENTLTDCNAIFLKVFPEVKEYHNKPITLEHFQEMTKLTLSPKDENDIILKEHMIDGVMAKYRCHLNDFHDDFGHFLGHILILNDVTKELNALEEAESATKAKSAFLSSMSHEIRTPINAVLGMDELILRESEDPQILEYATNISNAGKLLLSIINDILDISKMESGSMNIVPSEYKPADMINSLHAIIDLRAKNKGLDMHFDISPTLPSKLYGDEMRIQQCIANFLTNAVKYTPSGQVTLTMDSKMIKNDEILLLVSVEDSGIGIKEEDRDKLFKTFQRLDETKNRNIEGTGLGLHLTHNLIQLMDGEITVTSEYGKGSTFSFAIRQKVIDPTYIDLTKTTLSDHTKYEASFTAKDAKVLVVDDNKVNLAVLKGLLKNTMCRIDTVNSGFLALEKVAKTSYDIIFLDHLMPEMDGIEALCKMKESPNNLSESAPVIALTANVYSGASQYYKEAGFTDYLSKPVDAKLLEEIMIKYLNPDLVTLPSAKQNG